MPEKFPHTYSIKLSGIEGKQAKIHYDEAPVIQGGPPKEFDGVPTDWSPEGFLMSGVGLCFLTTLKAIHRDEQLKLENLSIAVDGTLDKTKDGLVFTKILTHVSCQTNDVEQAIKLFHKAEKYCLVSNALKTQPELLLDVTGL